VPRELLAMVKYSEALNHYAHTDGMFVTACRAAGAAVERLPHVECLHLSHDFAWYANDGFL